VELQSLISDLNLPSYEFVILNVEHCVISNMLSIDLVVIYNLCDGTCA
jgi:hypothetical protein